MGILLLHLSTELYLIIITNVFVSITDFVISPDLLSCFDSDLCCVLQLIVHMACPVSLTRCLPTIILSSILHCSSPCLPGFSIPCGTRPLPMPVYESGYSEWAVWNAHLIPFHEPLQSFVVNFLVQPKPCDISAHCRLPSHCPFVSAVFALPHVALSTLVCLSYHACLGRLRQDTIFKSCPVVAGHIDLFWHPTPLPYPVM